MSEGISTDKILQAANESVVADSVGAEALERLLGAMECGKVTDELLESCPELAAAQKNFDKLQYRKKILQSALKKQLDDNKKNNVGGKPKAEKPKAEKQKSDKPKAEEPKAKKGKTGGAAPKQQTKMDYVNVEDFGSSILGLLTSLFKQGLTKAFPDIQVPLTLTEATNPTFGDYQCNSAMALSAKLKATGVVKKPFEVANEIKAALPTSSLYEKVEVVPAGFINIFLNQSYILAQIRGIAVDGVKLPKVTRKKVIVDFSSPNIAKEMHVGHLRSTIIGDSICRLLEKMGFEVDRVNHIGDWGTQFGMLIAHLYDKFPDFLSNMPAISDLQAFYKESKKRFDEDAEFKKRAYDSVVRLQSKEPEIVKAWTLICNISKKYNQNVYDRLDVVLRDVGESFYQDKMISMVEDLKKNHPGALKEEEGRLVMFPTNCEVPLTVVKSDGGYTYDTSDLAALNYRINECKADWAIYVVDAGQNLHLETVYAAARDLGWYDEKVKRVEHVMFGLVLGEDKKKFKTRSGETVRLLDLLDEGVKRAAEKLIEKKRDQEMTKEELDVARDAVAYGCIKYADLSHTRSQDYVFSFDRMLDDRGNTAVYLLYAYARIRSIVRNTGISPEELKDYVNKTETLPLSHPREIKLAKQILKLSDVILQVLDNFMLHQICDYIYNLATSFHDFYNECYVIEKLDGNTTIHYHRLTLCEVTANAMLTCFEILGIREVPKM
ncbi:unnamed protein product [Auanema sp. JU1783]|nr:unnamed protein product [Auanema sp. JU1783]